MVDEPIALVPYDPRWPEAARLEIGHLQQAVGDAIAAIEHFGSTAVPGCDAKPIVDLLVGVRGWPPAGALRDRLVALGYEDLGEAGVPGRIYLRARQLRRGGADFNLAVTLHDGPLWRTNLAIREALRGDPALVRAYVAEKRAAIRDGCTRLLAYSDHKSAFLRRLVTPAVDP